MRLPGTLLLGLTCCMGCGDFTLDAFDAVTPDASSGLLDDFEDRDNRAGTDGWWYPQDDGTGPEALMSFEPVNRQNSQSAVRFRGGPTQDFGAFLGLDLPGGVYDATSFDVLVFAARAESPVRITVRLLDSMFEIHDANAELGVEWREVRLPLSTFIGADMTPVDSAQLTHLQLWIVGPSSAFDLWIDDVWFRASEG